MTSAAPPLPDRGFLRANAPWLGAGALLTFSSSYGQTFFIAVFSGVIREEYGLSHGDWGGIYALGTTASAVIMIWLGTLADRFRVRDIGTWVLIGLSLACLCMAALPGVWALPFVILALRLFGQGMCSHLAITAMARWFAANRGRALSTAALGFTVAEAILPIVFVALLTVAPWRSLWVLAAILPLVAIVFLRRLLRSERNPRGDTRKVEAAGWLQARHWTRAEALRHPLFWCILPAVMTPSAFMTALMFHQVHLSEVKGILHLQFVALLPIYTTSVIAAMLGSGWLVDRLGAHRLIGFMHLPMIAGFLLLSLGGSYAALAVALILMGVGQGANSTVPAAYWAEAYGTAHIGAIKALAASGMVLGSALGPVITGRLIDAGFDLPVQALWIALWFCLTSLTAFAATRLAYRALPA